MTVLYLIRHGEVPRCTPRRFLGQRDLKLTETGRQQIKCLADYLAKEKIERFVCSSLSRCVESCEILSSRFAASPEEKNELREINLGDWDGLTMEEVRERFPGAFEARGRDLAHYRPEGGESFLDLQERVWPMFETIAASGVGSAALVAHSGVNRVLLSRLLGMNLENIFRIEQHYGCMNIIRYERDTYRLERMNFLPG